MCAPKGLVRQRARAMFAFKNRLEEHFDEIDAEFAGDSRRRIVLHCASGVRSAQAARTLAASGIEVSHLAGGLPAFNLVGLPDTEVKESRERVRAALVNSGFAFPHNKRITVNLAPADLRVPRRASMADLALANLEAHFAGRPLLTPVP